MHLWPHWAWGPFQLEQRRAAAGHATPPSLLSSHRLWAATLQREENKACAKTELPSF